MANVKLPANKKRGFGLKVMVTQPERRELHEAANRAEMSVGSFVRKVALAAARQERQA